MQIITGVHSEREVTVPKRVDILAEILEVDMRLNCHDADVVALLKEIIMIMMFHHYTSGLGPPSSKAFLGGNTSL